jgi:hypothetical protein
MTLHHVEGHLGPGCWTSDHGHEQFYVGCRILRTRVVGDQNVQILVVCQLTHREVAMTNTDHYDVCLYITSEISPTQADHS